MIIMALDLGINTGYAVGAPGNKPRSGSVRLKRRDEPRTVSWRNIACFLRDQIQYERPDLVVYEAALDPIAMRELGNSAVTVVITWGHVAAVEAICGPLGIRTEPVNVQSVRRHFTGRARWGERDAAKRAVVERCWTLGYFGRDCRDDNRADACATFDFACATYGRRHVGRRELHLYGEVAS